MINKIHKNEEVLSAICNGILERSVHRNKCNRRIMVAEDRKKFESRAHLTIYNPFVTLDQLHNVERLQNIEKQIFFILSYTCQNHVGIGEEKWRTFKIMAGPNETSVILIAPTRCANVPCFVPVELIKNITSDYFLHIEDYF